MLKHCVFLRFRPEIPVVERTATLQGLAGLVQEVEGLLSLEYGENLDFEGKSPGFLEGFIATFTDRQAHLRYEAHPDHIRLGNKLVDMCVGGHQGIVVFDLDVGNRVSGG